jgi:hypothetical protein
VGLKHAHGFGAGGHHGPAQRQAPHLQLPQARTLTDLPDG